MAEVKLLKGFRDLYELEGDYFRNVYFLGENARKVCQESRLERLHHRPRPEGLRNPLEITHSHIDSIKGRFKEDDFNQLRIIVYFYPYEYNPQIMVPMIVAFSSGELHYLIGGKPGHKTVENLSEDNLEGIAQDIPGSDTNVLSMLKLLRELSS